MQPRSTRPFGVLHYAREARSKQGQTFTTAKAQCQGTFLGSAWTATATAASGTKTGKDLDFWQVTNTAGTTGYWYATGAVRGDGARASPGYYSPHPAFRIPPKYIFLSCGG